MRDRDRSSLRPEWWTKLKSDLRNNIRQWEEEIAAGTFNADGKLFPFVAYDHDSNILRIQIPHEFVFPKKKDDPVARRSAQNLQIADLYCNNVPTSPRSEIAEEHVDTPKPTPPPSPTESADLSSPGMFVRQSESDNRRARRSRREHPQASEPPPSPTPVRRVSHRGVRRSASSHVSEALEDPSEPARSSARSRRRRKRPTAAADSSDLGLDSETDRPIKKTARKRIPKDVVEGREVAYPVNEPRGKLYMDTRDLRNLDLTEVQEQEGIHPRPETLTHFAPTPAILRELSPVANDRRQETEEELFNRLNAGAVDKHRARYVNGTKGVAKQNSGWGSKSFGQKMKIRDDFGQF